MKNETDKSYVKKEKQDHEWKNYATNICGTSENLGETATQSMDGRSVFTSSKMPTFRHVQRKVLNQNHEKQGMLPKLFHELGPFFRIRQLRICSCSLDTGQQQREKLSLTPTNLGSSY